MQVYYADRVVLYRRSVPRNLPAFRSWTFKLLLKREEDEIKSGGFEYGHIDSALQLQNAPPGEEGHQFHKLMSHTNHSHRKRAPHCQEEGPKCPIGLSSCGCAMNYEDRVEVSAARILKNQLLSFAGGPDESFQSLNSSTEVQRRVIALRETQNKHDEFEVEYNKEKATLDAKYQNIYYPLYEQKSTFLLFLTKPEISDPTTMATPQSHRKKTSKSSRSNFLGKSLIVILVLVIIPLFPSQAPDFIRQSIFPQLWELLHLMFIGIAVCYGLFSKRSSPTLDLQTHPRFDASSPAYLSGISNVSSIFDSGHENLYGSYGKIGMPESSRGFQNLGDECEVDGDERCRSFVIRNECQGRKFSQNLMNSQHFIGESTVVVANRYHRTNPLSFVDNKPLGLPVRSLRSRVADTDKPDIDSDSHSEVDRTRILSGSAGVSFRGNDSNVVKIRGMVPVNSENEFEEAAANLMQGPRPRRRELGEETRRVTKRSSQYCWSQSASEFEFREFRHFRSTSFQQPPSSRSSSKTSSPGTSTPSSSPSQEQQPNFEGKMDLEEEFPVSISQPTEISVHGDVSAESSTGSSMQMEDEFDDMTNVSLGFGREEVGYAKPPSHSIGESEHEYIKSWSFWHPTPSETNSKSSSPTKHSPVLSVSPELPNIEMHDHQEEKDVGAQSISVSHPIVASMNGEAAHMGSSTGHRSEVWEKKINGEAKPISSRNQWPSSTEINPQRPLRDSHKDVGEDVKEGSSLTGKRIGPLDSRVKPSPSPRRKVLLRGKSVRTIRASRLEDDLKSNDSASVKSRSHCSPVESLSSAKSVNGGGCENGPVNTTGKGGLDTHPVPNSAFSPKQNGRKEASVVGDVLESREDSVSVLNNSDVSSDDEKPGSYLVDDVELGSEVDRKAGEFIAKFREQIRLQKVESFRRSTT
nr:uncharacterized protein LOC109180791 [Ipomoea batatas]